MGLPPASGAAAPGLARRAASVRRVRRAAGAWRGARVQGAAGEGGDRLGLRRWVLGCGSILGLGWLGRGVSRGGQWPVVSGSGVAVRRGGSTFAANIPSVRPSAHPSVRPSTHQPPRSPSTRARPTTLGCWPTRPRG